MNKDFRYINDSQAKISPNRFPVLFEDKADCCGCGLCYTECGSRAAGAISMIADQEGFAYPQVDLSKCIGCRLCMKKCPIKSGDKE